MRAGRNAPPFSCEVTMKIDDIINAVDKIKANEYDESTKIDWISNLDAKIHDEIMLVYNEGETRFVPYTSVNDKVIANERFKQMYVLWLMAQIDFHNAEAGRYENEMIMFNNEYSSFERQYIRNHKARPIGWKGL